MINKLTSIKKNESGAVAIIVTTVIMAIVTLIVVGFATISRREQRQSLDDQLSTQAFYAAESGINYASVTEATNCTGGAPALSLDDNTEVTCLFISGGIQPYLTKDLSQNESWVTTLNSNIPIHKILISWGEDGENLRTTGYSLPSKDNWDSEPGDPPTTGMIKLNIVPAAGSNLSRDYLIENSKNIFLYPNNDDKNEIDVTYTSANKLGGIMSGKCGFEIPGISKQCNASINVDDNTSYVLRLRAIYQNTIVEIRAFNASGDLIELPGQNVIDSTGKSFDVLRRIKVVIPESSMSTSIYPEFVVESMDDICKQYTVYSGGGINTCGYSH